MNVRRLSLAVPCLVGFLMVMPASAYEQRDERSAERTTYQEPTPHRGGWIANHNHNHRLRLEREERGYSLRHHPRHARDGVNDLDVR